MLTRPDPVVDLRAFANTNFALGALFSFVLGIGLYGSSYLVPLFLARVRGYDSLQIGETMFIAGGAMFLGGPVAGWLMRRLDLRIVLGMGLTMIGVSMWWLGTLTSQSSFADLAGPQALRGASILFVMLPANQIALGSMPPDRLKNASGLYNLMRNLGGAIGLATIDAVSTWRLAHHLEHLQEQVTWARTISLDALDHLAQIIESAGAGASDLTALKYVAAVVQQQGLTLTCNDVLLLMGGCFLCAVPLVLAVSKSTGPIQAGH
jgi:DHA2 family multidrug resistance protein